MNNKMMMEITKGMPMKQINIDGKPYLQRYYAGEIAGRCDLWIHRFLSSDGDRAVHNHPFLCKSFVILGGYDELIVDHAGRSSTEIREAVYPHELRSLVAALPNRAKLIKPEHFDHHCHEISPLTWHRISYVEPETWTMLCVWPDRVPFWYFREGDDGHKVENASPRDWWKSHSPRVA